MNEEIEIKEKLKRTCCKFSLNNGNGPIKVNITKKARNRERWSNFLHYFSFVFIFPLIIFAFIFAIVIPIATFCAKKCEDMLIGWRRFIMRISGLKKQLFLINLDTRKQELLYLSKEYGEERYKKELKVIEELQNELSD
jgi:hypothetical protein